MDFDRRVADIIEGAEKALAALSTEAAAARDYPRATAFLAMAQRVSDAARASDGSPLAARVEPAHAQPAGASGNGVRSSESLISAPPPRSSRKSKSPYPRFKREDDTLVKIGWSKSDRETYEHRSPRDVLDRLVVRIVQAGGRGDRFTTEQLMPLHDSAGSELPSYQAYLCLAWLVAQGLIERHGRQGYTVANAASLPAAIDQAWSSLPKR